MAPLSGILLRWSYEGLFSSGLRPHSQLPTSLTHIYRRHSKWYNQRMSERTKRKDNQPWYKSAERGPLVVAWLQLASVWVLAFVASRTPSPQQATSKTLENIGDVVALISFVQFFTGMLYLFLYPHCNLRKRFVVCLALFFSLVVIVATKQGVVTPRG